MFPLLIAIMLTLLDEHGNTNECIMAECGPALVDTGADYSAFPGGAIQDAVDKGHAHFKYSVQATLGNGSTATQNIYKVDEVSVGKCTIRNVDVAMTTDNSATLGLSVLKRLAPITFNQDFTALEFSCPK